MTAETGHIYVGQMFLLHRNDGFHGKCDINGYITCLQTTRAKSLLQIKMQGKDTTNTDQSFVQN